MADTKKFLRMGVTGGLGSGKSVFCGVWKKAGAAVFNADSEAKRLIQKDPVLRGEVTEAFGAACFDQSGRLRTRYLAGQVFRDAGRLRKLNQMAHPRVLSAYLAFAEKVRVEGTPAAVIEAALIYEAKYEAHLDIVVVVRAPEAARIRRVAAQGRLSESEARLRINRQRYEYQGKDRGDYFVDNNGSLVQLERLAVALWKKLTD